MLDIEGSWPSLHEAAHEMLQAWLHSYFLSGMHARLPAACSTTAESLPATMHSQHRRESIGPIRGSHWPRMSSLLDQVQELSASLHCTSAAKAWTPAQRTLLGLLLSSPRGMWRAHRALMQAHASAAGTSSATGAELETTTMERTRRRLGSTCTAFKSCLDS